MHEFISASKESLKTSREVAVSEVADFSLAQRAATELRAGR